MPTLHVGQLRWKIVLANQQQLPNPRGPGIINTFVSPYECWSKIDPIATVPYLMGVQLDLGKLTHKIIIRNTGSYLTEYQFALRDITRNDGSSKTEIFRLHRMLEVDGRQRFYEIEAELISSDGDYRP